MPRIDVRTVLAQVYVAVEISLLRQLQSPDYHWNCIEACDAGSLLAMSPGFTLGCSGSSCTIGLSGCLAAAGAVVKPREAAVIADTNGCCGCIRVCGACCPACSPACTGLGSIAGATAKIGAPTDNSGVAGSNIGIAFC